ncbi:MAG: hypothetical protein KKF93_05960 [Candidatus Omnitrophica bacterium]|nr:hypothetical protein [Candidatus Omnitrophota bacterium]
MGKTEQSRNMEDLEFEIRFFKELINKKADFVDALIPLAEAYTKTGRYLEGLRVDKQLAQLLPYDCVVRYNLACSYALLDKIDEAFRALSKAIKLGYGDFRYMGLDPDLAKLRDDKRYKELINRKQKKRG